jgi:hypothetical protein
MDEIKYYTFLPNTIDYHEFLTYLEETDNLIVPCLSTRVNLEEYAKKATKNATMFVAKKGTEWIGVEAVYFNEYPNFSYNTLLSVKEEYQSDTNVGMELMLMQRRYLKEHRTKGLRFSIRKSNKALLNYHIKTGGRIISEHAYPGTDIVEVEMEKIFIKD